MRSFLACAGALAFSSLAIFTFQPFGQPGWHLTVTGTGLAVMVLLPRVWPARWRLRSRTRPAWRMARRTLLVCLTAWIALIIGSHLSPGGSPPGPKDQPASIRVATWNILRGADDGPLWLRFRWNVRAKALRAALQQARPDVLCLQEALAGQVEFVQQTLPHHSRVGVGRDDGRSAGEHCAIYFDRDRFQELSSGTFWLEGPADSPPSGFSLTPRRICTWVRVKDRLTGQNLRIYNTHLSLTEPPRLAAVRRILRHVATGDPGDAVLIAGDFNAPPTAASRQLFTRAGFVSGTMAARQPSDRPTNHFYGIRLRSLDAVLLDRSWRVHSSHVVDVKPGNTFPSDHLGVLADVEPRSVHPH